MSDTEEEQPKTEPQPPVSEQIIELYRALSLPFHICRAVQVLFICGVLVIYVAFVFVELCLPLHEHTRVWETCGLKNPRLSMDLTNKRHLADGSRVRNGITFPVDAMFEYKTSNNKVYTRGCPCSVKNCVRKCCPKGERLISPNNLTCIKSSSTSYFDDLRGKVHSRLVHGETLKDLVPKIIAESDYYVLSGLADCYKYLGVLGARYEVEEQTAFLMEDGTALTHDLLYLDIDDYCMDQSLTTGDTVLTVRCVKVKVMHDAAFWYTRTRPKSEWVTLIVSVVALAVALVFYIYVPQLWNLHGILAMGFVVFLVAYDIKFIVSYKEPPIELEYLWQFTHIGSFCWLTALGFDLWLWFSGSLKTRSQRQENMKYLYYSLFALGVSAVFCGLSWAVGVVPNRVDSCPKPRFEDDTCLYTMERATRHFYNLPVVMLVVLNLVMYVSIRYNIKWQKDHPGKAACYHSCGPPFDLALEGFNMYSKCLKVVVFTGMCYMLLTTPFYKQCTFFHHNLYLLYYAQGLFVFVALCLNARWIRLFYLRKLELHLKRMEKKRLRGY